MDGQVWYIESDRSQRGRLGLLADCGVCVSFSEKCDGSLWNILHSKRLRLRWVQRLKLAKDIAQGMQYRLRLCSIHLRCHDHDPTRHLTNCLGFTIRFVITVSIVDERRKRAARRYLHGYQRVAHLDLKSPNVLVLQNTAKVRIQP